MALIVIEILVFCLGTAFGLDLGVGVGADSGLGRTYLALNLKCHSVVLELPLNYLQLIYNKSLQL